MQYKFYNINHINFACIFHIMFMFYQALSCFYQGIILILPLSSLIIKTKSVVSLVEQVKVGGGVRNLPLIRFRVKLEDILVLELKVSVNVSSAFENDHTKEVKTIIYGRRA